MTKKDVIAKIAKVTRIGRKDAEKAIDAFVGIVKKNFEEGEPTAINGFGKFYRKEKKGYTRQSSLPSCPEKMVIPDRAALGFKSSKKLCQKVVA